MKIQDIVEDVYPLTPMQQGMLFHTLEASGTGVYVQQYSFSVEDGLDRGAFRAAWQGVIDRHAALRTSFEWEELEAPHQIVHRQVELPYREIDWAGIPAAEQQARLRSFLEADVCAGFELSDPPLMRVAVIRLAEDLDQVVWTSHHILLDGWSLPLLFKEFSSAYAARRQGRTLDEPRPRPFRDYVAWLQRQDLTEAKCFWREHLKGVSAPTPLGVDTASGRRDGPDAHDALHFQLSQSTTRSLKELAGRHQLTLNTIVQGAWALLLSRYSGSSDVMFGCVVSGRPADIAGVEAMVGLFINTLPVRVRVPPQAPLVPWLKDLQEQLVAVRRYEFSPLVSVKQWCDVPSGLPMFESIVGFENYPLDVDLQREQGGMRIGGEIHVFDRTNFPLTIAAVPGDRLSIKVMFDGGRFERDAVGRLCDHLEILLEAMLLTSEARLVELPLLTASERTRLVSEWNATRTSYPGTRCVNELFEAQAAETGDAVAVEFEGRSLTYGELNARANRLGHLLRELGVGPDTLVAICVQRSLEMVVGLLGILKAGGAYVPLDAEYPQERLAFMLRDARAPVVVTQESLLEALPATEAQVVCLDRDVDRIAAQDASNPASCTWPEHLAYVSYTSGSTGRPKGVGVPHRAVVRLVKETNYITVTGEDAFLQFAPVAFDASTLELWGSLLNGARLVVMPPGRPSLEELAAVVRGAGVTTLWLTAPLFHLLVEKEVEALRGVRQLLAGGDVLSVPHVRKALDALPDTVVINGYGPTENTTFTCCHRMTRMEQPTGPVPIGRPISNTRVYILDGECNPVPVGVPGELHIGGAGLARGYVNAAGLTAEKFIPDPFGVEPGGRLYRTGDLTRYLDDGSVEFLGRIDHQVKVRGFRIELGEVESTLVSHSAVREAVVLAREDTPGERRLVAYVLTGSRDGPDPQDLKEFLEKRLPDHMVPSAYVFLEAFPLTPSGKVDRAALPAPEGRNASTHVAPRTTTEDVLAAIWADVLDIEHVGVHDNFFDLGGHSLLATRVSSRIRESFQTELPLRAQFEAATLAELAGAIDADRGIGTGLAIPAIEPAARDAALPLSFAQQRLWFLDQLVPGNPFYNIPGALRLRGELDVAALSDSVDAIVARHEVLRTTYRTVDGQAVQVVNPPRHVAIPIVDLGGTMPDEREIRARAIAREEAQRPFDLSRGPLLRLQFLRLSDHEHILVYNMHHIVSDGWSMGILVDELAALYAGFAAGEPSPLSPLAIQYGDFARWQRRFLEEHVLDEQLAYWQGQLDGLPEALTLPTDRPRPAMRGYRGAVHPVAVPEPVVRGLRAIGREAGTTLFMTLLAVFQVLLHRYSGQSDFAVGSPIAHRNRAEVERLIGFFVNTLVLRADLSGRPTFEELLARTREATLGAYSNQDVPFERLVEELQPDRDMSHLPLVQVVFALQNAPMRSLTLPGLELLPWEFEAGIVRFDMELHLREESSGGLTGQLVYDTELFQESTVARLLGHFGKLLEECVADPERPVVELPLLTASERTRLVSEWNATRTSYPGTRCVNELFEAQAAETGDAVAVEFEGRSLTYGELNARANRLGHLLRELGVGPDTLVAICVQRSLEMVVGLLGILKAGGAYVPLDAEYPQERLAFMLRDARAPVVVTQESLLEALPATEAQVVCLDRDVDRIAAQDASNPASCTWPEHLAYVSYTSGSTGRPKGVGVPHRAVVRLVKETNYITVTGEDAFLQFAPVAFDASTLELWGSLLNGARLVVMPPGRPSLEELAAVVRGAGVTTLWLTAPLFHLLVEKEVEALRGVRQLLAGGDVLSVPHVRKALDALPDTVVINGYGPTENTTFTCCHRMTRMEQPTGPVPIGRPISNTRVYILDGECNPVPVGVPGELHIGGAGLARGYVNAAGLTAEKFIPDPFGVEPGGRLYRTGDLTRYLDDGSVEFLGRIDHQVKVRGFRIELGEVESTLVSHSAVREAVVLAREDTPGERRLVAYVVAEREALESHEPATALQSEQVASWRELYEDTYSGGDGGGDPRFDITGWNSSYTGEPIAAEQMREWVDGTVSRIRSLGPKRVLEIGCGTGLLLFRLLPECTEYVGLDFSPVVLEQVRSALSETQYGSRVTLLERQADDLRGLEAGRFDTVVLNSVVQYFPHVDYLLQVLEGALERVGRGGKVFVGDVRSLALVEAFHASVELARAETTCTRSELRARIERQVSAENELLVDPGFFVALRERFPRVSHVEIRPKVGESDNELTKFRYDVSLHLDGEEEPAPGVSWLDWVEEELALEAVRERLSSQGPSVLGLRGVPNGRLMQEQRVLEWLAEESGPQTVGEARWRWESELQGLTPGSFEGLSEELPYAVDVSWAGCRSGGSYDVVFWRTEAEGAQMPPGLFGSGAAERRGWQGYANNPLSRRLSQQLVPVLRRHVEEKLPDYMAPSAYVFLDGLPLTPNGKVDRRGLPAPDGRTAQTQAYVAPGTTNEKVLARIWAEVLGMERVGIHDNFFELGGDSILGIQIMARATQARLELSPRQLFEHQTVAELAAIAGTAAKARAEQGPIAGPVELTPIQHWFFEMDPPNPQHFNQSVLLEVQEGLEEPLLEQALDDLLAHHDALRLRFERTGAAWRQVNAGREESRILTPVDLSGVARAERGAALRARAAELQESLDLGQGPLVHAALFHLGEDEPDRLLIVVHHLAVDGVSWRILLEDLQALYRQRASGQSPALPPKSTSFKQWAERLEAHAQSDEIAEESEYWISVVEPDSVALPIDTPGGANTNAAARTVNASLTPDETRQLLQEVPAAYRTQISDLLLAGLATTLSGWLGPAAVLVDLESHGREDLFDGIDVSRTVGWFTSIFPVRLDLSDAPLGERIRAIKEQLRAIPHHGVGYGLLRYLARDPARRARHAGLAEPQIGLNYLGQLDRIMSESATFAVASEARGPDQSPLQVRRHLLDVNGAVLGGRLTMGWTYSSELHREPTVTDLANGYMDALRELIDHCRSHASESYTPSDFPDISLDQEELDRVLGEYER